MKLLRYTIYAIVSLAILSSLNCKLLGDDEDDPCDGFIMPQITVTYHFAVRTFYQVEGEERQPLPHARMNITVCKELCGGETKGTQTFDQSDTGEDNVYNLTPISYNLHNAFDACRISVDVYHYEEPEDSAIMIYGLGRDGGYYDYEASEPYDNMTMIKYIDVVFSAYRQ